MNLQSLPCLTHAELEFGVVVEDDSEEQMKATAVITDMRTWPTLSITKELLSRSRTGGLYLTTVGIKVKEIGEKTSRRRNIGKR